MQIFKKLMSVILATSIVIGCGAVVSAAGDNDIKISEENFPDDAFRKVISQKIDWDHDGYISINERYGNSSLDLWENRDIKSIEGINKLGIEKLVIYNCSKISKIDLSRNAHIKKIQVMQCNGLKSFKGSAKLESAEFSWCLNLETLDLKNCSSLKTLILTRLEEMDGALDLTACPNLKYLTLVNDYFSTVLFNSRTKLIELYINTTPITNIDLSTAVALNTTTKIYINSDYKLKGLRVPSNILNILINHRTINKYGTSFSYSGQGITITID